MTDQELQTSQLKGLQWTVQHAYTNSEAYRNKFDQAHIHPHDIQSLNDLRQLPFANAQDLTEGYPFPLLSKPMSEVVRLHSSSGTTGKRKILCYTQKDINDWTDFFARCFEYAELTSEDRVQICVGYGLWTAGVGFQTACEKAQVLAIPAGPGNLAMQMEMLVDFQTTVICCTASMGLLLAEEIERRGLRNQINLKKMIYGSERSSDAMREKIKDLLNLSDMYDITGMTELYGPGAGIECSAHQGIHYWADYYILEILNPDTLEPVSDGEIGEMVVTTLKKEAVPLIRYRTRDLASIITGPCSCGRPMPRHTRLLGRTDDMFIFRGVNVYPGQLDSILSDFSDIGSEYQVILSQEENLQDKCILKIERAQGVGISLDGQTSRKIQEAIKHKILVTPKIKIVDYASLPRSERKTQRVIDQRK